ncbi:NADPH-dependent oxidoreductase [Methanobrevibacter cuticularis]|uniref:NADPH-dependent oxidoreductase n=1 Tax=Methanobrevibacter cuticularis TaxID=47311 RepID=A0A166DTY9_9EURY|nr:nitroreductase family protein [Methanobrevibacter cuticularis]KZX15948.1 NADPH-dependent oxidoreductase [Methanobrevibacter cuticularis]
MELFDVINKRKSVRNYLDEDIDEDSLKKIAKAGQIAPIAGEFQITIIKNKEIVKKINDIALEAMKNSGNEFLEERAAIPGYQPIYNAPVLAILSAPEENVYGGLTVSCVAENMILAATDLGLGSCYMITPTLAFMSTEKDELSKEIGLPKGFNPICAVAIGKEGTDELNVEREEVDNVKFIN